MSTRRPHVRVHACLLVGFLMGGGPTAPFTEPLLHRKLAVYPGTIDLDGRYRSILQIDVPESEWGDQPGKGKCSGNLIAPRLVVTAAHCVCPRRPTVPEDLTNAAGGDAGAKDRSSTRAMRIKTRKVDAILEPSTCVKDAVVNGIVYETPLPGTTGTTRILRYHGTVRAHPEAEILFEGGEIVSSNADLAVIILDAPAQDELFPVYKLTDEEVKPGDRITFVGYGWEPKKFDYGERRFGGNEVSWMKVLGTGNTEIVAGAQTLADGGMASHINLGDSGGGCFKADDNKVLVGVIASHAQGPQGEFYSVMTSVYANRLWLLRQIIEARGLLPPEPSTAGRGTRDGGAAVLPAVWQVDLPADAGVLAPVPDAGTDIHGSDGGSAPSPRPVIR